MAVNVWPVNAVAGSPQYQGRVLRQTTVAPFLDGARAGRPLGARSGVRPGTPATTVSATSGQWTVAPHAGVLDVETAAEAGPYAYSIDQAVVGVLTAADQTNPRWDGLYMCVDDPAEGDGTSTPRARVEYKAGTPNASPSMPSAPARSMLLARIVVPKSGGGSPSVVWLAPRITAAGGIWRARDTNERDAIASSVGATAADPLYIHRADAGSGRELEVTTDGTTWRTIDTTDTGWLPLPLASGFTAASGQPVPAVRRLGDVVYFNGGIQGTFTGPANVVVVAAGGIPAACRPSGPAFVAIGNNSTTQPMTRGLISPDGSLAVVLGSVSPASVTLGPASFARF